MIGRSDSRRSSLHRRILGLQQRRLSRLLTAEGLESRRLLSVSASWNSSLGKLSAVGTSASDEIYLRARSGYVSVENESGSVVHWDGNAFGVTTSMLQLIEVAGTDDMGSADGADELHLGDVTSTNGFTAVVGVTLNGGAGDDVITGSGYGDLIIGHKGKDRIVAAEGDDTISALYGTSSDGGEGSDTVYGGGGNDSIDAGNGIDIVDGGDGDDWIHGGDGTEGDNLAGGAGNDTIYGGDGGEGDTIAGGAGNDSLIGGTGSDFYLYTGTSLGEDVIVEGASAYSDSIDFGEFESAVTFDLGSTSQQNIGGDTKITLSDGTGMENIRGTSSADHFTGNARDNFLFGGGSEDTLIGNNGNDLLHGQGDNDLLQGGDGRDVLVGGLGTDTLQGHDGDDLLWGGEAHFSEPEEVAWSKIFDEWVSVASYNLRVAHISGDSGGANGGAYLSSSTLVHDSSADVLTGGSGSEWLLADLALDNLTDQTTGELTAPNTFPITSGIGNVSVNEDANAVIIDLLSRFADGQQASSSLIYALVSNTNSALFSSVSINPVTGELTLSFAANQSGSATLTISATDSAGFTTSTSFDVTVAPQNDAPEIDQFEYELLPSNQYRFHGHVADVESAAGLTVTFGGLLEGYTAVTDSEGRFVLTVTMPEDTAGFATAQVIDSDGLNSDIRQVEVIPA